MYVVAMAVRLPHISFRLLNVENVEKKEGEMKMMAFFNGKKKSKFLMTIMLVVALVVTCVLPAVVFADEHIKPEWSDYENEPQTEIDPEMQKGVDDAQQKAKEADDAAKAAEQAAKEATDAVVDAEKAAEDAKGKSEDGDNNAGKAEQKHEDGSAYADGEETKIETSVNSAVVIIEDKTDEAKAAAKAAAEAAKAAADAEAAAKAAVTTAEAEKAAKDAADAAALAQTKANEANNAYLATEDTLNKAKKAYDDAVAAANIVLNGYNNDMQAYIDTVNNFDIVLLKKAYDEAATKANDAAKAASDASTDADAASQAAAEAADKTINYFVNPAEKAYEDALKAKADADIAKLEADRVLAEKQKIEAQKQTEYNAVKPALEVKAKADQQIVVNQKQAEYDKLKAKHDSLHKIWGAIERGILKIKMDNVKNDINKAKSDETYKGFLASANAGNSQYQEWAAAQNDRKNANTVVDEKLAAVTMAANNCSENSKIKQSLNKAINDRDAALTDLKAVIDSDPEIQKLMKEMKDTVDGTENDINKTVYDDALYDWANAVQADVRCWFTSKYGDASDTTDIINKTYTKDKIIEKLDKYFPYFNFLTNTDKLIEQVEDFYRQELKLQEEKMAMNQAYLAQEEAKKATEFAESKRLEALQATTRLSVAQQELAQAEKILAEAKARVAELEKVKLDTKNALDELNRAKILVDDAKKARDEAQESADDAKKSSENANEELGRFTVGGYSVQYLVSGSSIAVADEMLGNTTASAINLIAPALYADYNNYKIVGVEGAKLESDGTITLAYNDSEFHEHTVTVWYDKPVVTPQPSDPEINNPGNDNPGNNNSGTGSQRRGERNSYNIEDEEVPASPINEQVVNVPSEVTILDEKAPAGPLPKTGGVAPILLYGIGLMMAGSGVVLRRKDKQK